MSDAPDLTPEEAKERWLNKRSVDSSDSTIETYRYRLKLFVEWCEENEFTKLDDLTGWDLEEYEVYRRESEIEQPTVKNELGTLKRWLRYLGRIQVVPADLHDSIEVPTLSDKDASNDTRLKAIDTRPLLVYYRSSGKFGTRQHVLLELAWYTGARVGGLRALDLRDVDLEEGYVWFEHRPDTETPLKNGNDGQRAVGLPEEVVDSLRQYIDHNRDGQYDDQGRQPLLTGQLGRPATGTLRDWMYRATLPCLHSPCPHGHNKETCEYREHNKSSGCPSSRSPHQVRTGAITWMLNCGLDPVVVSDRVNASVEVIRRHYDKQDAVQEMEIRRRPHLDKLDLDTE